MRVLYKGIIGFFLPFPWHETAPESHKNGCNVLEPTFNILLLEHDAVE